MHITPPRAPALHRVPSRSARMHSGRCKPCPMVLIVLRSTVQPMRGLLDLFKIMNKSSNPLIGWTVDRNTIKTIGQGLQRPECILAERDGTLWSAGARGGVMCIRPDGTQQLIAQTGHRGIDVNDPTSYILGGATLPNGIAMNRDGNFLIANFGTDAIELMHRDGNSRTLYAHVDGQPLGKTNFVLCDSRDRVRFTVTTRLVPWTRSISEKPPDGYVGLIDERGIRIVAEGFVGTNEIRFDAREEWLYVVEANAARISQLRAPPK